MCSCTLWTDGEALAGPATAFVWAHASWDNVSRGVPSDGRIKGQSGDERRALDQPPDQNDQII
jgi:hypothetical protein